MLLFKINWIHYFNYIIVPLQRKQEKSMVTFIVLNISFLENEINIVKINKIKHCKQKMGFSVGFCTNRINLLNLK